MKKAGWFGKYATWAAIKNYMVEYEEGAISII